MREEECRKKREGGGNNHEEKDMRLQCFIFTDESRENVDGVMGGEETCGQEKKKKNAKDVK